MADEVLLLSIHPEYAARIFDGKKTIELRKTRPRVKHVDIVLVYVSSPTKALIGKFTVEEVVEGEPQQLWRKFGSKTGIDHQKFNQYFQETEQAFGIVVQKAKMFAEGISLDLLRERMPGFHPPQSYRYFNHEDLQVVGITV